MEAFLSPNGSRSTLLQGPAGRMEVFIDAPSSTARGVAVVAHPHPLLGGTARHKVPHVLARSLCDAGWLTVRPNFRGTGLSEGAHDEGRGEASDLLWLTDHLRATIGPQRLALIGFSFGAFVQAQVAQALAVRQTPAWRVCLLGTPFGSVKGSQHYATPAATPGALVVHGEHDERVPLQAIMDWARPKCHPVVILPGADHFFNGHLPLLWSLVVSHLTDEADEPGNPFRQGHK